MNSTQDVKKPGNLGAKDIDGRSARPRQNEKTTVPAPPDPVTIALKRIHDDVVDEPLPDDFLALLGEIDAKIAADEGRQ